MSTKKTNLFFDIETGGLSPKATGQAIAEINPSRYQPAGSSILSIAWQRAADQAAVEQFARPEHGSWLSKFSEEKILPQLAGRELLSEKEIISNFIDELKSLPTGSKLSGYNIKGFDIPFIRQRAREHGLRTEMRHALRNLEIWDTGSEAKDTIARSLAGHIQSGTFSSQLGGMSYRDVHRLHTQKVTLPPGTEATYKRLREIVGYVKNPEQNKLISGWKLENIYPAYQRWANQGSGLASSAHQASADVQMTRGIQEALDSGSFKKFTESKEFAYSWLDTVLKQRANMAPTGRLQEGRVVSTALARIPDPAATRAVSAGTAAQASTDFLSKANEFLKGHKWVRRGLIGAGVLGAAVIFSSIAGKDDAYNTIEGMSERGVSAQNRKFYTEFGSGYQGINPAIAAFNQNISTDGVLARTLELELQRREEAAQEKLGSLQLTDLYRPDFSAEGINPRRRDLRAVKLDNFNVQVEDADSLILSRRGNIWERLTTPDVLIRLSGIDAPETAGHSGDPIDFLRIFQAQPGGNPATEQLQDLISEQRNLNLLVSTRGKTYGRYVGALVGDGGQNLNIELARRGAVSSLPFGPAREDIVSRAEVSTAELTAINKNIGMNQYARYKATRAVELAADRDITYNTLTRIDKLAGDLRLGRMATYLEGFGDEQRDLTPGEYELAVEIGKSLRTKRYKPDTSFQTRFTDQVRAEAVYQENSSEKRRERSIMMADLNREAAASIFQNSSAGRNSRY